MGVLRLESCVNTESLKTTIFSVFLFVGLVLTTLAVDVMGSACIERIHSIGRGLDAMALLRALKSAKGVIGNK